MTSEKDRRNENPEIQVLLESRDGISPRADNHIEPREKVFRAIDRESCESNVWVRAVAIGSGIGVLVALIFLYRLDLKVQLLLEWVQHAGTSGPFIFIGVYVLTTIVLIPGSILTVGGGLVFGFWIGVAVNIAGVMIGSILAFLFGRFLFRNIVEGYIEKRPRMKAIDRAIESQGRKVVLLVRLSPIMPYCILNYVLALTKISFIDYTVATFLGMLPGTILFVYIGSTADSVTALLNSGPSFDKSIQVAVLMLSGVLLAVTVTIVTISARRMVQQAINEATPAGAHARDKDVPLTVLATAQDA